LKLLQINASYKPAYIYGGPTMSVSKLSEELAKAGCDTEVFTTTANGSVELPVSSGETTWIDGVKVTYFKRLTKDHTHYSPALFKKLHKDVRGFNLVHIHAWWNLISVLSCRIALKHGIPVIVSPRGTLSSYSFSNKNSLAKRLIHTLLGEKLLKKSYIHVTSEREREAMEKLTGSKKIFNIPNFISFPAKVPVEAVRESDHFRLIFLSRIEEKKGLEILFEAMAGLGIPYRLTIAGDGDGGYVNDLKKLSEERAIAQHIDWIGFQGDEKFDILKKHDLFVLPSYDENFGNAVIESLSMGTAVLISDKVGLAGYVEQNELGWICLHDAVSFREKITSIAEQPDALSRIRKRAPCIIRNDFSEDTLVKKYIEMYQEVIANG
jgi:glycosyltransferase involved in cell wall biosynthesis